MSISLETSIGQTSFAVIFNDGERIDFSFPAIVGGFLGNNEQALSFMLDDVRVVVHCDGQIVFITLNRDDIFPKKVVLTSSALCNVDSETNGSWTTDHHTLSFVAEDGTVETVSDHKLALNMTNSFMSLKLMPPQTNAKLTSVRMFTSSISNVPIAQRPPEFTTQISDVSGSDRALRPTRFSIPVISCVSVLDAERFALGLGTPNAVFEFKATPTYTLPNTVPVYLTIWMPNGLDTVAGPTTYAMNFSSGSYYAQVTFAQEDTIKTVDGFGYFSVYTPLTVQDILPMSLDIGSSIPPEKAWDVPSLFSVADLPQSPEAEIFSQPEVKENAQAKRNKKEKKAKTE